MFQANTLLFPSNILHSKDLRSISIRQRPRSSQDNNFNLIICHKDDASSYKSTRKISRTAKRLISTVTIGDVAAADGIGETCTGYWIGSQDTSQRGKNDEAILRRLESEFGRPESLQLIGLYHDNNSKTDATKADESEQLNVLKFCSTKNDVGMTEARGSELGEKKALSIIFLDLDGFVKSFSSEFAYEIDDSGDRFGVHWALMENVMCSLTHHVEGSSVIHLKSDVLYRTVSTLLSSIKNTDDAKPNFHVMKSDLDNYLASKQSHSTSAAENGPGSAPSAEKVIRRLRRSKGAADCPLSLHPIRYIELSSASTSNDNKPKLIEICRFHNYDAERGCLRTKKARLHPNMKGCGMDHDHCHKCGVVGHRALDCTQLQKPENSIMAAVENASLQPMVFKSMQDGSIELSPVSEYDECQPAEQESGASSVSLPALLVLGGRLRGRTLASCEVLPLCITSTKWIKMPNLLEHRGSHAACSPMGTNLAFVMGGGGVDGNLDSVECFSFKDNNTRGRWEIMTGRLPSPRHAFGSVACINGRTVSLFAVGGWKYGSVSCESTERLSFEYPSGKDISAQWEMCAPLLKPRRLHSVVANADGSSIYVFGGFIDERFTTSSIERYDIASNQWHACGELPFGDHSPLVQAIPDWSSEDDCFLIFPFSSCENGKSSHESYVLRYRAGVGNPFSPVLVPHEKEKPMDLPIKNWASFSATSSRTQQKAYLIGGTIDGKWTARGFELDLRTMKWTELSEMVCARRRLAAVVIE